MSVGFPRNSKQGARTHNNFRPTLWRTPGCDSPQPPSSARESISPFGHGLEKRAAPHAPHVGGRGGGGGASRKTHPSNTSEHVPR